MKLQKASSSPLTAMNMNKIVVLRSHDPAPVYHHPYVKPKKILKEFDNFDTATATLEISENFTLVRASRILIAAISY